jgi:hypothetical protein
MGLHWNKVEHLPPVPATKEIIVHPNPHALGKQVPLLWRFVNPWVVLKVENHRPYRLYFDDGKEKRMYKKILYTPFVAVRSSNVPIRFVAVGTMRGAPRGLTFAASAEIPRQNDELYITYV